MAAGDLTDGAPHAAREGVVFCIPATGNGTVNGVVDLPGPGATSLPGIAQIVPTPTRSWPCDPWRSSASRGRAPGGPPAALPDPRPPRPSRRGRGRSSASPRRRAGVIDLPGPGATSLPGIAQIVPTPTP